MSIAIVDVDNYIVDGRRRSEVRGQDMNGGLFG
jgi:hypothetical protein